MKNKLKRITSKLYPELNAQRRFELCMRHLARGNGKEASHVARSCPMAVYTMADCNFTNRMDAAEHCMYSITAILREILAKLDIINVFVDSQGESAISEAYSSYLFKDLKSFWDGYSDFCLEFCGLEPEDLLKAYNSPLVDELERIKEVSAKIPGIEADRERVKDMIVTGWRKKVA